MLGITSITFRDKSVEEIFEFCKSNNVDCIEWGSDIHAKVDDLEGAQNIKKLSSLYRIKCSSYGSYYRLGEGQDINKYINIAKIIEAPIIRIWAGKYSASKISIPQYNLYIEEAKTIANVCLKNNITLAFEYHRDTLTDIKESALNLINDINKENVKLYWQPNPELSIEEKISEIRLLSDYIISVHFFYWDNKNRRLPLILGKKEWLLYLKELNNNNLNYLLEFCLNDSFIQGSEDLKVMEKLLNDK